MRKNKLVEVTIKRRILPHSKIESLKEYNRRKELLKPITVTIKDTGSKNMNIGEAVQYLYDNGIYLGFIDIKNADCTYLRIPGADLTAADLRGVCFDGANLERCDFSFALTDNKSTFKFAYTRNIKEINNDNINSRVGSYLDSHPVLGKKFNFMQIDV